MLERDQRELIGMVIAAIVAAIGITGMLLTDLRTSASSDADLITASTLSRAGATSTPSERPIDLGMPKTVPAIR
jgi:Tfp pilus assembly protein FimT